MNGAVNLADLVIRQAERTPGALALVGEDQDLTYGELEELSARVRSGLVAMGVTPGARVCLVTAKTPVSVAAILGVLRAGGVYVPIDPQSPASRSARMVRQSDTSWIIADQDSAAAVAGIASLMDVDLQVAWLIPGKPSELPGVTSIGRDRFLSDAGGNDALAGDVNSPAYIMFTSGSTGEPKGVVITHANVVAFLEWAVPYFGIDSTDRLSAHPPLHFDLSVFDLFGALSAGATLHLVPAKLNLLPNKVAEFIEDAELTQWFSVPGVMTLLSRFDLVRKDRFPTLRRVLWCGEVLPTPVLMDWMEALPDVEFTNLYGPTEATIASSYYTLPAPPSDPSAVVPIGRPCTGEELLVLDSDMDPVVQGDPGDLWIGGVGLSPGYWRDPARTADAFVDDPRSGRDGRLYRTGDLASVRQDGELLFHGRSDRQIKSRGYRIELDEIEIAINALSAIRQAAVVAIPSADFGQSDICCAYVPDAADDPGPAALRDALTEALPAYMIPRHWRKLARLPQNANGKVHRGRVEDLFRADDDRR